MKINDWLTTNYKDPEPLSRNQKVKKKWNELWKNEDIITLMDDIDLISRDKVPVNKGSYEYAKKNPLTSNHDMNKRIREEMVKTGACMSELEAREQLVALLNEMDKGDRQTDRIVDRDIQKIQKQKIANSYLEALTNSIMQIHEGPTNTISKDLFTNSCVALIRGKPELKTANVTDNLNKPTFAQLTATIAEHDIYTLLNPVCSDQLSVSRTVNRIGNPRKGTPVDFANLGYGVILLNKDFEEPCSFDNAINAYMVTTRGYKQKTIYPSNNKCSVKEYKNDSDRAYLPIPRGITDTEDCNDKTKMLSKSLGNNANMNEWLEKLKKLTKTHEDMSLTYIETLSYKELKKCAWEKKQIENFMKAEILHIYQNAARMINGDNDCTTKNQAALNILIKLNNILDKRHITTLKTDIDYAPRWHNKLKPSRTIVLTLHLDALSEIQAKKLKAKEKGILMGKWKAKASVLKASKRLSDSTTNTIATERLTEKVRVIDIEAQQSSDQEYFDWYKITNDKCKESYNMVLDNWR